MEFLFLYVTHPDRETATRIVDTLLEARLIACANTVPITSAYWWQGRIERAQEVVTIMKTRSTLRARVEEAITAAHPYEVPCIVSMAAEASEPFGAWIQDETREA